MGKDFRVGLITGVVLAGAALVWVATRPNLSPQARIAPAGAAASQNAQTSESSPPWESADSSPVSPANPLDVAESIESQEIEEPLTAEEPQPMPPAQQAVPSEPAPQTSGPDLTIHEQDEPIKTTRFHIVRKNETLSGISQQYYGAQDKWRKIVAANAKTIKDPNKIAPGTKLIIPD